MRSNKSRLLIIGLVVLALSVVVAACQPAAAPTVAPTSASQTEDEPTEAPAPTQAPEPTDAPASSPAESAGVMLPEVNPLEVTGDIVTAGSSTVFPLSERMAERFQDEGYAGNITIDSIGSGAGFERFCVAGETDISNASRAIKDSRGRESCQAIGREPIEFRVGTDALAVVVSQENDFIDECDDGRAGDDLLDGGDVVGREPGVAGGADPALHPGDGQRDVRLLRGRGVRRGRGADPERGEHAVERGRQRAGAGRAGQPVCDRLLWLRLLRRERGHAEASCRSRAWSRRRRRWTAATIRWRGRCSSTRRPRSCRRSRRWRRSSTST